jgi:hypothetical protein
MGMFMPEPIFEFPPFRLVTAAAREKAKVRRMLAELYNWFTEGFDTKDL